MTADGYPGELTALLDDSFTTHRGAALTVARRILGDANLAEDAVQLAFVQILVRVRSGDAGLLTANPRAVVLRGARWAALKLAERDRDRHAGAALDEAGPSGSTDPWEHAEARLVSRDIIAGLPSHYRDALVLRYLEDQPDDSAAARLALTVKAYRRRLDRALVAARSRAAGLGSGTAGALAALVRPHQRASLRARCLRIDSRIRQARARLGSSPGGPGFSHFAVVVAVAGISAAVLAPQDSRPPATTSPQAGVAAMLGPFPTAVATTPPSTSQPIAAAAEAAAAPRPPGPPAHTPQPSALVPLLDAPPPSQTTVVQALPASRYENNHVVVLSATVPSCQCVALYRSDDGGATWRGHLQAQLSGGFSLPPHYPDDPRVVAWGGGKAACILASFDATACTPLPLFGRVAFDARFDSGNQVLYGAATMNHGFLAYNVGSGTVRPLVIPSGMTSVSVQTPPADTVSGVYLVAQASPSSGISVDGYGPPQLFTCDGQLRCQQRSKDWTWDTDYVVDRLDTTGLVVGGFESGFDRGFTVSTDGGASVAFTAPKNGTGTFVDASYALIGPPGDVVVLRDVGGTVVRWWLDGRSETLAPVPAGSLVAVTPLRYIAFATKGDAGFWCTVDGGHTWQRGCPPER